jgi:hypothetical protein
MKYDPEASSFLKKTSDSVIRSSTRVNSNKILHQRFNTAVRKNSYSVRIAKYWNKLPDNITNASSINAFKNRLDKHWKDEDIYYLDYKSEINESHANRNVNAQESEVLSIIRYRGTSKIAGQLAIFKVPLYLIIDRTSDSCGKRYQNNE